MLRISVGRVGAGAGIAAVAALAAFFGVNGEAAFAEDNNQGATPAVSEYATGLNNPRGLDFGPDGNLWVAESGMGAEEIGPDTPVVPGEANPEGGGDLYIGYTGAFTRIENGEVVRVYTGLPSIAAEDGSEASGPSDVSFHSDGTARGIIGLGADPAERDALVPGIKFGYLGVVDSSGEITGEFDISAFEGEINPDFGLVDSNPNGVLAANNGGTYVVDAGANALLYVDSEGNISITATFVDRLVDTPPFLPQPPFGPQIPMQAVPTSATFGPDGAIYVAELTGFPFPEGEAQIWRVVPGEPATVYMSGFTNIIDLAFDDEGNLYVLEIDTTGLATEAPGDGALWMVPAEGGDPQMIVGPETLFAPGGVTIGPDGDLYVTNNGILAGQGQVLRIDIED